MSALTVAWFAAAWCVISLAGGAAWAAIRTPARAARLRRHEDQAIALTRPERCPWVGCNAEVYDARVHLRLAHGHREVGAEDSEWWAGQ